MVVTPAAAHFSRLASAAGGEVVAVAHVVGLAGAAGFLRVDCEVDAGLGEHVGRRPHRGAEGGIEREAAAGVKQHGRRGCAAGPQPLQSQTVGPRGPVGLRQSGEVAGFPQATDELRVRRRDSALLVERAAELPQRRQRLHVVAADLAGHVAAAAKLAFERDVHNIVVHFAPPLYERQHGDQPSASPSKSENGCSPRWGSPWRTGGS